MNNNEKAMRAIEKGFNLENGQNGETQDFEQAINKFMEAVSYGEPDGYAFAGECYHFYIGNKEKAVELYIKGYENGSAEAKFLLGCCYYDGIIVEKDTEKGGVFKYEALQENSGLAQRWFRKLMGLQV